MKRSKPFFREEVLKKAPLNYWFMRKEKVRKIKLLEGTVRNSYSKLHDSKGYQAYYPYKPVSRIHFGKLIKQAKRDVLPTS